MQDSSAKFLIACTCFFILSACSSQDRNLGHATSSAEELALYYERDNLLPRVHFDRVIRNFLSSRSKNLESLLIVAGFPDDFGRVDDPSQSNPDKKIFLIYEITKETKRNKFWLCTFSKDGIYESSLFADSLSGEYKNLRGGMSLLMGP